VKDDEAELPLRSESSRYIAYLSTGTSLCFTSMAADETTFDLTETYSVVLQLIASS
jgi:hypothetical protein